MNRPRSDPYLAYTRRFFDRWVRWYDLFAAPLAPVYRAAAALAVGAPGGEVLDVCTGTGQVAHRCRARGGRVTAGDITVSMLRRARSRPGAAGVCWLRFDARALPFPDGRFPVATLSFALHDMPRQARARVLDEVTRVADRLVVVDYELPGRGRTAARRLVELWESPWFRDFARFGIDEVVAATGWRTLERRRWPWLLAGLRVLGPPSADDGS